MHQSMYKPIAKLITFVIVLCTSILLYGCERNNVDPVQELVDSFNEDSLDFKLYYLGKDVNLLDLEVTYVTSISSISFNHLNEYTFIVINNLDGLIDFQLEELITLKTDIETYGYAFYYFGNSDFDVFHESGLLKNEVMDPSSLSFGYVREGDRYINVIGTWDITANQISNTNDLLFLELLLNEFKYQVNITS